MDPFTSSFASFNDYLSKGMTFVLDGGFASQLEADGLKFQGDPLWSARALITNPEKVVDAHKQFLAAGAHIIETNSYQAALPTLESYFSSRTNNFDSARDKARSLLRSSVQLARQAITEFCHETGRPQDEFFVAGSVGPYAVVLHDGSEYTGDYVNTVPAEEIVEYYFNQANVLVDAGVDILAFETIPTLAEAGFILEAIRMLSYPPVPIWISFSCRDGTYTCGGDRFADVVSALCIATPVSVIGINCTAPEHVSSLLKQAAFGTKPFVVYPNSGEKWDHNIGWHSGNEGQCSIADFVSDWVTNGAKIIGGCCRVGPNEIQKIADHIMNMSNPINISNLNLT